LLPDFFNEIGQKQTFAVQSAMSALPPKADMCGAKSDVCFVPIADIEEIPGRNRKTALRRSLRDLKQRLESTSDGRGVSLSFLAVPRQKIRPKHVSAKQN
jgi:hypothetical protein